MIYAVDEIQNAILPVAVKYWLRAVYLFGSYARGTAAEASDIDLIIDTSGMQIKSLLQLAAVYCELEEVPGKPINAIHVITESPLEQKIQRSGEMNFRQNVWKEKVNLYVAA